MKLKMIKNPSKWFLLAALVAGSILSTSIQAQNWTPRHYWTFNTSNSLADSMGIAPLNTTYFQSPYTISNAQANTSVGKYLTLGKTSRAITSNVAFSPDSGFTFEMLFRPAANINEVVQFVTRRDGAISIRFCFPYFRFTTKSIPTGSSTAVTDNWDLDLEAIGRATYGYYVDGNWHHLVFKYNAKSGVKEIWVDGQLPAGFSKSVAAGVIPSNSGSTNNNIIDLNTNTSYYQYVGDMDEIALYTYALPNNMIYKHYQDFTQRRSYTFANSTVAPPAPSPVTAGVDPTEYAPGHPNSNVDALVQLKTFPAARNKPSSTLFPNFQVFNPAHVAGDGTSSYSQSTLVRRSKEVQIELVKNFNYALMVTSNTSRYSTFGDTNNFDGAWVKLANQNPSWKTSANTYWPQLSPKVIGKSSTTPYIESKTLPSNSYLRNNAGQYLDMYGNITTSGRTISPESPLDSLRLDGQTQRYYLTQLTTKMTRPIDLLFENGEVIPSWTDAALQKDPAATSAYTASGLGSWKKYKARGMKRLTNAYMNEWRTLSGLTNTRIYHYYLNGHPVYAWDWAETRTLQSFTNNQYYSSNDIYMQWPGNWRYWQGAAHGWQFMIEGRHEEITLGDKLFSPVVSPGWNSNEEVIPRPAQWLGFLKAVSMAGAENFGCGYFVTSTPYQNPSNYVWQMAIPGYAQAIASRYDDLFFNGTLLAGDVPQSISSGNGKPGYTFYAGDFRKLVIARKHNTQARYAITGTIQPNSNMTGNAELEGDASIKIDGQTISFKIRRQGSTYIYDKTNVSAPVFYQLDAWHESTHPYYWSKTFNLEAEIFDNTSANFELKTQVPAGTTAGDYRNYTTYLTFKGATGAEYNFTPRGTTPTTHYVWVRARSRGGVSTGFNLSVNGTPTFSVTCITDTNWTWYRYNASNGAIMTLPNLALSNQKITITPTNTNFEIDLITITPTSGNYYSSYAAPCGITATATITPNGSTTFCQGGSVTLSANSGNSYLWSNGSTTQSINVNSSGTFTVTVTSAAGSATSSPATVTVNALPSNTITYSGSLSICQGSTISLTSSAASGPYLWSTGATTKSINAGTSGSYTVTVTGTNGCTRVSSPVSVTVNAVTPSTITPGGSTTLCTGGSVTLSANTGTSYLWSNGATTKTINVNSTGNYIVTVTQTGGCSSTSAATAVSVGSAPTPTIAANGPTTFCTGGNVVLTASSGTAYLWSNGATTTSITASTAGSYTVRVSQSGGCSATSAPTTVSIGSAPVPNITASGPTTFCTGSNVTLTATAGTAYLWSNGATTQAITTGSSGNYTVRVSQSGGCSATSAATTVTVGSAPIPSITASGPTSICSGGSVTLTASTGIAYLWSNGQTTSSITVSTAGTYTVRVTQSGGCSATSFGTSITTGSAPVPTITASGPTTFCSGGSVTLTASNGTAYLWSNGATTKSVSISTSGNYTVRVTQAGGCSATSSATAVSVGTGTAPTPTITAGSSTTFCQGGSVALTASTGTSYLWSNGATTKSITASAAGNYYVSVSQSNGCSSTSSATTITVNPVATFTITPSGPLSFCQGGSVRFNVSNSNASTYVWYKNNVVVYTGTSTVYSATTAGVYKMRAQLGSCGVFSNPYTVTIPCREGEVLSENSNFIAYPNPFSSMITFAFELSDESPVSIRLFDATGKLIDVILDNSQVMSGETRIEYGTTHLPGGIYIAEISTPQHTQRIRIVSTQ
ncbi:MAG: T9SS type A sorting domain-containing protein [Bacteroidia bacterium]|nr:T9SS type A sorting domain-containing protein [Bacteroidia bacterium]